MKHTVMLVDDCRTFQLLMTEILAKAGYEVTLANHGQEALNLVATSVPDLLVTDLNMPVMDGAELARTLKSTEGVPAVPVIGFTAGKKSDLEHVEYFDKTLTKPIDTDLLFSMINELLGIQAPSSQIGDNFHTESMLM